jgi:hypothetical protein
VTINDKIIHSGDTNTAIRFPAADIVSVETNGSERARIDSSGRLLVGTSSSRDNNFNLTGQNMRLQVEGTDYLQSGASFTSNSNTAGEGPHIAINRSRGTTVGSNTVVQAGDRLGLIAFQGNDGTDFVIGASIDCVVDGAPGANDMPGRLVFSTTADGASSPTQNMFIRSDGAIYTGLSTLSPYNNTTASAANGFITSSGYLGRSTSSIKYKTNVETLENQYADNVLNCRPVYYRSLCNEDNATWGWWGFIAEEVAQIDPRLVHWKTVERVVGENGEAKDVPLEVPEPEGVQYDRFVPHLLNLIKRQKEQIEAMEARLSALEGA